MPVNCLNTHSTMVLILLGAKLGNIAERDRSCVMSSGHESSPLAHHHGCYLAQNRMCKS